MVTGTRLNITLYVHCLSCVCLLQGEGIMRRECARSCKPGQLATAVNTAEPSRVTCQTELTCFDVVLVVFEPDELSNQ
jgi:hypothetical protein